MKSFLITLGIILFWACIAVPFWLSNPQRTDSNGEMLVFNAKVTDGSKVHGNAELITILYDWYLNSLLVEQDMPEESVKMFVDSVKKGAVIRIVIRKIPNKTFWIPVIDDPVVIVLEDKTGEIDVLSPPKGKNVRIDFAVPWPR